MGKMGTKNGDFEFKATELYSKTKLKNTHINSNQRESEIGEPSKSKTKTDTYFRGNLMGDTEQTNPLIKQGQRKMRQDPGDGTKSSAD